MNNDDRIRLAKFEEKLDMMFNYEKERDEKICKQLDNHEKDIGALKRNQDIMYGVAITISLFIVAILKKLGIL
ncbi:TPA_asm: hypothetical protein vir520_00001 [Caudoviricetes sp. vir520]|nr:TPA_asm: hypothetical protein vir520_00001 [Caudoviricetes sp. vir520]